MRWTGEKPSTRRRAVGKGAPCPGQPEKTDERSHLLQAMDLLKRAAPKTSARRLSEKVAASPEGQGECIRSGIEEASLADWLRDKWPAFKVGLMNDTAPPPSPPESHVVAEGGASAAAAQSADTPPWLTATGGVTQAERHAALLADPLAAAGGSASLRAAAAGMAYTGAAHTTSASSRAATAASDWIETAMGRQAYLLWLEYDSPLQKAVRDSVRWTEFARTGRWL